MTDSVDVAVVGATGLVGGMILELLAERGFPVGGLHALASSRSVGRTVQCGDRSVSVADVSGFDFSRAGVAFFAAGREVAAEHAPRAAAAGCAAIDLSGRFAGADGVPLAVPAVAPDTLTGQQGGGIIATPGSAATQLFVALRPLHEAAGLTRVEVTTCQSVSAAGRPAVDELAEQTARLLNGLPVDARVFPRQVAFNVFPECGDSDGQGHTAEERRVATELALLLGEPALSVAASRLTVPVFYGHSQSVRIETRKELPPDRARALLEGVSGIAVPDGDAGDGWPMAVADAAGSDRVHVGRLRADASGSGGLGLWVVCDNVRLAALNSVHIAEILVKGHLQV